MPQPVLYLDKEVQLEVLVPNILVGTANVDMCGELSRIIVSPKSPPLNLS